MKSVELLSPAGTLKNMQYAFAYGADAVYAGQPRYSLRVRNNDFNSLDNLQKGIEEAHSLGKLFYVASNIAPHNAKLKTFLDDIKPVIEMKPDALIMSDPGLIMMVRENFPEMDVHLSVQANAVNYAAVKFWQQMGLTRVILSRELSLDEIKEIRQECPDMELEVFVHGALCIAYSGRCLLSGYMNHRDPNQGTCTNACRWQYDMTEAKEDETAGIVKAQPEVWTPEGKTAPQLGEGETEDRIFLLEEQGRKGEQMPIFEDEHGTYIMNSKDLRAVQHIEKLIEIGVDSLKIEGRTKSHYYAARTAQVYRRAIDDALEGKPFNMQLMDELDNLAHRGYTEGFYRRHVHDEYQNYINGSSVARHQKFVGEITHLLGDNWVQVEVKNKFSVGDSLELLTPEGNQRFILKGMINCKDSQPLEVAAGSRYQVRIQLPRKITTKHALLMQDLPNESQDNAENKESAA